MAAKTMVLVAKTIVYKVLTIVFLIVEQSFANPSWLFLELAACSCYCLLNTKIRVWLTALRSKPVGIAAFPGSLQAIVKVFPSIL
jgi:hypothetical protein